MELKKDELFGNITKDLGKWGADKAHHYMFIACCEDDIGVMCSCSMEDMALMLSNLTLGSPESACAIKKVATYIDDLMQSEPIYQKLKDDKDLSDEVKDEMFKHYFKQCLGQRTTELIDYLLKCGAIDPDDEAHNDEE